MTSLLPARRRTDLSGWRPGDAFLAGGSWLFSEPQPGTTRLIDLTTLGWAPLRVTGEGLDIGATCTMAELSRVELPGHWPASALVGQCCRSLLGSFKVLAVATVGGNIALALPAGPMTSLTAALDGVCTVWTPDGGERLVPVTDLVVGAQATSLRPGEVLRSVSVPASALRCRTAFRQHSLTALGRSAVVVIGRLDPVGGGAVFTVTASTTRPVQLRFDALPEAAALIGALDDDPQVSWHDDVHGLPAWRAHLTRLFLAQVRDELVAA